MSVPSSSEEVLRKKKAGFTIGDMEPVSLNPFPRELYTRAGRAALKVYREIPLALSNEEKVRIFGIDPNVLASSITRVSPKEPYVEGKGVLSAGTIDSFNPGWGGDDPGYLSFAPASRGNGKIPSVSLDVYNLDHRVQHIIFCSLRVSTDQTVTFSMGRPLMWGGDFPVQPGRSLLRFDFSPEMSWGLEREGISIGPWQGPAVDAYWEFYYWEIFSRPFG